MMNDGVQATFTRVLPITLHIASNRSDMDQQKTAGPMLKLEDQQRGVSPIPQFLHLIGKMTNDSQVILQISSLRGKRLWPLFVSKTCDLTTK